MTRKVIPVAAALVLVAVALSPTSASAATATFGNSTERPGVSDSFLGPLDRYHHKVQNGAWNL